MTTNEPDFSIQFSAGADDIGQPGYAESVRLTFLADFCVGVLACRELVDEPMLDEMTGILERWQLATISLPDDLLARVEALHTLRLAVCELSRDQVVERLTTIGDPTAALGSLPAADA